jgi:hypothetical protein
MPTRRGRADAACARRAELGVNVACLDGVSPFDFREVTVNNGRVHPRDAGPGSSPAAGILRFEPNG